MTTRETAVPRNVEEDDPLIVEVDVCDSCGMESNAQGMGELQEYEPAGTDPVSDGSLHYHPECLNEEFGVRVEDPPSIRDVAEYDISVAFTSFELGVHVMSMLMFVLGGFWFLMGPGLFGLSATLVGGTLLVVGVLFNIGLIQAGEEAARKPRERLREGFNDE